jgi:peptidyl-prolyl cis-trans isomerase D
MLTWISENAKWVIYIFIIFIVAGLLFMDMSQLKTDKMPPVGKVNGEALSNDLFNARLQQLQQQNQGRNLTEEQNAQMRNELFRSFVQQHLIDKVVAEAKLAASVYEMQRDLRDDPPAGVQQAPVFMTDSVFDKAKYEAWLNSAETYDRPEMLEYEQNLRQSKIPLKQLQLFVVAGFHPSSLEAKWNAKNRETRMDLWVAQVVADSFPVQPSAVTDAEVDAYFQANPDSFYVQRDLAQVDFVALPLQPSARDEASTLEYANLLLNQIREGADFAEIARMNSEDPGSAEKGGSLGDFAGRGQWVKEFEEAAFALDSGALSAPIRTPFGYHIIKSEGKQGADTSAKVKISHILLKVNASPETVDSLETLLQTVKADVDAGKKLADAAAAKKLTVTRSSWFGRGEDVAGLGFVPGLSSYAFFNPERPSEDEIASPVLQNKQAVVLAVKVDSMKAGTRSKVAAKQAIVHTLQLRKSVELAAKHLQANLTAVQALAVVDSTTRASIAKVTVDSASTALEGFVPGLGYATPQVFKTLTAQKEGAWGSVIQADQAAVAVKVLRKTTPSDAQIAASATEEQANSWRFGAMQGFNEYLANLEAGAEIVNNMDLYYRD